MHYLSSLLNKLQYMETVNMLWILYYDDGAWKNSFVYKI